MNHTRDFELVLVITNHKIVNYLETILDLKPPNKVDIFIFILFTMIVTKNINGLSLMY